MHNSPLIYNHSCLSVDQLHNESLTEFPTILDSLFHKIVNLQALLYVARGWWVAMKWWVYSHEVVGSSESKLFYAQTVSIQAVVSSTYYKIYIAKFMASFTSQLCGDSLLAIFLSRQDEAIYKPPEHSWASDRLKNEASVCCILATEHI